MSESPDLPTPRPSPLEPGAVVAGRWRVGERVAVRGDLHVHEGRGPDGAVRVVGWRYRGSEPLPRFLAHLGDDSGAWGALRHSHLVPTLDCGRITSQTTCFWVTEDPGGPALTALLAEHPVLAPEVAVSQALHVGEGVLAAHVVGLVHGDLDPHNVHLVGHRARLAWGGLATRVELSGMDAGRGTDRSLSEVAPEVLQGRKPGVASDVYGLCALLFRTLAGQPPFLVRRGGPPPGLAAGEALPPLPVWVAPALVELLQQGLQRDADRRPERISDVLEQLSDADLALRGAPVPAGAWAPAAESNTSATPTTSARGSRHVGAGAPTPTSTMRTASPALRRGELDPALANTPASASRSAPSPGTSLKSLVPDSVQVLRPPPPPARPRLLVPLVLGGAVGAFLLFGLGVYLSRPTPPPVPVPVPVPVSVAPPVPAPPAPVAAVLTLRSAPPGATVWEDGQVLGTTPVEVVLTGGPGDPPRAFELRLPGYARYTVRQAWSAAAVDREVALQKLALPPPVEAPKPEAPSIKVER